MKYLFAILGVFMFLSGGICAPSVKSAPPRLGTMKQPSLRASSQSPPKTPMIPSVSSSLKSLGNLANAGRANTAQLDRYVMKHLLHVKKMQEAGASPSRLQRANVELQKANELRKNHGNIANWKGWTGVAAATGIGVAAGVPIGQAIVTALSPSASPGTTTE
jgi:hypothetical protein